MPRTRFTTRSGKLFLAVIAAIGIFARATSADEPLPDRILREKGLVRSGKNYVVKEADDLKGRIADLDRRFADWKREKVELEEQLETLGRLRLEHHEIMTKLRALGGRRPDSKEFGPRRPPDDGPRGPGSGPPSPKSGRFQPGSGPPPPPPDDMGGFGSGPMDEMMRQLGIDDSRRQHTQLNAERAGHAVEIVSRQVASEDVARKFEARLREIDQSRLEAVALDKEIQARHDRLANSSEIRRALAMLSGSGSLKVSLGRPNDYSKRLSELGEAITASRQGLLQKLAEVELKGMNRLAGLVGVAETLLQEMGANTGRMQTLEREAASRKRLLAEQTKQHETLDKSVRDATEASQKNQLATQLRARESRGRNSAPRARRFANRSGKLPSISRRSAKNTSGL